MSFVRGVCGLSSLFVFSCVCFAVLLGLFLFCVVLLSALPPPAWCCLPPLPWCGAAVPSLSLWAVLLWVVLRSYPFLVWWCFRHLGGVACSSLFWVPDLKINYFMLENGTQSNYRNLSKIEQGKLK